MNYIILDMEWNQGYPGAKVNIGDTRKHLSGEIIQIGAVKLDDNFDVVDSYSRLVKPIFYRKMHFKVSQLTGITKEMLSTASPFLEVFPEFIEWCGKEHEFLIWGSDDIAVLKQNIEINKFEGYQIHQWYNIQIIYNAQHRSEHKQVALATACEVLDIPQDLQLHDALNDAIYTAEVCRKLDMKNGLALCREDRTSAEKRVKRKYRYYDFGTPKEAFEFTRVCDNVCPICGGELELSGDYNRKYYNQFAAVRRCSQHGAFVENVAVAKINENSLNSRYKVVKTIQRIENERHALEQIKTKKHRRNRRKKSTVQQ